MEVFSYYYPNTLFTVVNSVSLPFARPMPGLNTVKIESSFHFFEFHVRTNFCRAIPFAASASKLRQNNTPVLLVNFTVVSAEFMFHKREIGKVYLERSSSVKSTVAHIEPTSRNTLSGEN
jgi:hypothetical protein